MEVEEETFLRVIKQLESLSPDSPDMLGTLTEILTWTKYKEMRQILGNGPTLQHLNRILQHCQHNRAWSLKQPLIAIRIVRNMCAQNTSNQHRMRESGLAASVVDILKELASDATANATLIEAGLQFLCNFVTANVENQSYTWKLCFPYFFQAITSTKVIKALDMVCMLVHNCVIDDQRREELTQSPHGLNFLKQLFTEYAELVQPDHDSQWVYVLLSNLAEKWPVTNLWTLLHSGDSNAKEITPQQLFIIKVLDEQTHQAVDNKTFSVDDKPLATKFIPFLVEQLQRLAVNPALPIAVAKNDINATVNGDGIGPRDFACIYSILQIFGNVTSQPEHPHCTITLSDLNAVPLLLKILETIWNTEQQLNEGLPPRRSRPKDPDEEEKINFGFKRDIIRIVANIAHQNPPVKDQVRECHGLELLLSHCNIDDNNPYIREWSLVALKNLCENNAKNQEFLAALKPIKPMPVIPELQQMGLKIELDPQTGKPKIIRDADHTK